MSAKPQQAEGPRLPPLAHFERLVQEANTGDPQALVRLRELLDEYPAIWQQLGDLAAQTQLQLILWLAGEDHFQREALQRHVASLQQDLAGDEPDPLERLAVQRVLFAWLHLHLAVRRIQRNLEADVVLKRFLLQTQASAERSLDQAMKSLLLVREKLLAERRRHAPASPLKVWQPVAEHQAGGA